MGPLNLSTKICINFSNTKNSCQITTPFINNLRTISDRKVEILTLLTPYISAHYIATLHNTPFKGAIWLFGQMILSFIFTIFVAGSRAEHRHSPTTKGWKQGHRP